MISDVTITYVNRTRHPGKYGVVVFAKNIAAGLGQMSGSLAWRVLENIGYLSSSGFIFPGQNTVRAVWGDGHYSRSIGCVAGDGLDVVEDQTGIVIKPGAPALKKDAVEVRSNIKIEGGFQAQFCKDGLPILEKQVAFGQKATFQLHPRPYLQPKLYWGLTEGVRVGQAIEGAIFLDDNLFELDIDAVTRVTVALTGYPGSGYFFRVEDIA